MRNLIIAVGLMAIGTLAYLSLSLTGSTKHSGNQKSASPTTGDNNGPAAEPGNTGGPVAPRRMHARPVLSEDVLAAPQAIMGNDIEDQSKRTDRRRARMDAFDSDGDGRLNMEERAAMRASRSLRPGDRDIYDSDGDGVLSESEEAARDKARSESMARRTSIWVSDADKDSDGLLSRSEAELASPRVRLILSDFDAADKDGDGLIDRQELQSAAQARRAAIDERRGQR